MTATLVFPNDELATPNCPASFLSIYNGSCTLLKDAGPGINCRWDGTYAVDDCTGTVNIYVQLTCVEYGCWLFLVEGASLIYPEGFMYYNNESTNPFPGFTTVCGPLCPPLQPYNLTQYFGNQEGSVMNITLS